MANTWAGSLHEFWTDKEKEKEMFWTLKESREKLLKARVEIHDLLYYAQEHLTGDDHEKMRDALALLANVDLELLKRSCENS